MNRFVRIYLLPGAMLQSVVIAGGYGTGREVVEYFTSHGIQSGFLGLMTAVICMSLIFCMSLEIARTFKVYDYRNFFKVLLGRWWFIYEVLGVALFMLVFAVIGSAAGEVLKSELGLPSYIGIGVMLLSVASMVFYGRELVTRLLAYWSLYLYAVFLAYLVAVFLYLGSDILAGVKQPDSDTSWLQSGGQYTFYNMTAIPIILYCAMAIETRRQAIIAGIVGAVIAIAPGAMLHLSFASQYPDILAEPLPVYAIFSQLDISVLKYAYLLMLFGTFVETGAGNLQGFMERLDGWSKEARGRPVSRLMHAAIAVVVMLIAFALSSVGIIGLIAEGYGTLAWGFLVVYAVPLFTIGGYRLWKHA